MDQLDLSDFFQTRAQTNDFFAGLEKLSGSIYKNGFNLEKALVDEFGIQKKDLFMRVLKENNINTKSNADLTAFLNKLIQKISKLPVLSMTVAFEPTDVILKALSDWLLLNVNKQIIFDITIDPSLIGGAAIGFNGKRLDCSSKPTFDRVLQSVLANKEKPTAPMIHQSLEHITFGR